MTKHKFAKKHAVKYSAAVMAYMYGASLVSPHKVLATTSEVLGEKNAVVSKVKEEVILNEGERLIENTATIKSDELTVVVDREFPNVVEYKIGDKIIKGTQKSLDKFKINGQEYKPVNLETKIEEISEGEEKGLVQAYVYSFNFPEINVDMKISLAVIENTVKIKFEEIKEKGDFKVKSIEIPNHNLVTINDSEEEADIVSARVHGILSSDDYFYSLKDKAIDAQPVYQTMTFLENGQLVASLENNVMDYSKQVAYQTVMDGEVKKASLWNGVWTYREVEELQPEDLPWCRIVISDDKNEDSQVDWQDGAIAYREHVVRPVGSDVVRDHISHVAMNFASQAQYPFNRLVDQVAKYSNYIDGFGQMMLVKGYQSEGHDSAHPDYGNNFNQRAGGVKEFNEMAKVVGEKYNTLVGVHINTTEIYPEAKYFLDELLEQPYRKGWGWLDQSYYVDKRKDVLNNTETGLRARLKEMKEATNELDWVYVDVYNTNPWNMNQLQDFLLENDWLVATEWSGPMRQNAIWTHWADLTYNSGNVSDGVDWGEQYRGTRSEIVRFVENEMKDVFPNDILLKGNKNKGFMGWEGDCPREKNIEYSVETFYNWTLPTKYMQHFPIIKWTENEVKFENDLISRVENLNKNENGKVLGGDTELIKDGNLIYSGTTYRNNDRAEDANDKLLSKNNRVFIPYSDEDINKPDKVYAWNDFKESREWTIPKSWQEEGVITVSLYKTSGEGRELVSEIPVIDGKITLELDSKTPYVVYKEKIDETMGKTIWSETSNVGDMGFDSYNFKEDENDEYGWWTPLPESVEANNVNFEKELGTSSENIFTNNTGQTYLRVDGEKAGGVTQKIPVEPGKDYSASVWVEMTRGVEREGKLEILAGNETFSHFITSTNSRNYTVNSDKHNTYFQRVKVDFTVPQDVNEITINLRVGEGPADSYVRFDNVRVVNHNKSEEEGILQQENYYYENFESVDEGFGPFVYGYDGPCQTHLSERNINGYTNDTINGDWSFKTQEGITGLVARTVPGLISLKPNAKYKISFKYKFPHNDFFKPDDLKAKYDVVIKSDKANGTEEANKMKVRLAKYEVDEEKGMGVGHFEYTFQTGNYDDYYIGIEKSGNGALVIDDLTINEFNGEVDDPFPEPPTDQVDPLAIPQKQMTAIADSEQPGSSEGPASLAIDGNEGTIWHTKWSGEDKLPQSITLDLGGKYVIDRFHYLPRQSGGNGVITKYKLEVSNDGENFTKVSEGNWVKDAELKKVNFDAIEATHVRLVAVEAGGGFASAAELNVFKQKVDIAAPTNLQIKNATNDLITVTWDMPENMNNVEGYVLFKDGVEVGSVDIDTMEYTFNGLNSGTEYILEVASKNSEGITSDKIAITANTIETPIEIKPEKIQNLKGESTFNSITVSWDAPNSKEGLMEYAIFIDNKHVATIPSSENSYTIKNLKANTLYGIKIIARYSNGEQARPFSKKFRTGKEPKREKSIINKFINSIKNVFN
ncbi:endo-alpha-N-acetylgalactosaminidase family protein [Clostridium tarantellae]|uniref:endo-alpha-N-acetylgalactosaminidase family protein n=1 Tax=Clostridium tarantellae TaxID=39493 RepID=UPI0014788CED|nr:endo-alpha-N-acetylgalactosaminidase family protein [Clostridium tarantellae]